jgi:hypothetical protein
MEWSSHIEDTIIMFLEQASWDLNLKQREFYPVPLEDQFKDLIL